MLVAAARVYSSGYHAVDLDRIARASGLSGHDEESPGAQSLTSTLTAPDGTKVATAKFEFANGYATVTIATTGVGKLTPGFHAYTSTRWVSVSPTRLPPPAVRPATSVRRRPLPRARAYRHPRQRRPGLAAGTR